MSATKTRRTKKWPEPKETGKVYMLYSGECVPPADTDDFLVLCCAGSLDEARSDARLFPEYGRVAIYISDYHVVPGGTDYSDNERFVELWP